jgi:hypothetical protein
MTTLGATRRAKVKRRHRAFGPLFRDTVYLADTSETQPAGER